MIKGMGYIRDKKDDRDYTPEHPQVKSVFEQIRQIDLEAAGDVDLRPYASKVDDQGDLGSCTAHAEDAAIEYLENRQYGKYTDTSRLFIYYVTRHNIEGTSGDVGAEVRDTIKAVATYGSPPESDWPYIISKFDKKPPTTAFNDALKWKTLTYVRLNNTTDIQKTLATGLPVSIGFTVYESFDNIGSDGIMPTPDIENEQVLGGHAVCLHGYKTINNKTYFIVKNSWGLDWGDKGYFYMPIDLFQMDDLDGQPVCSDFWVILTEADPDAPTPTPQPTPTPTPVPVPPKDCLDKIIAWIKSFE